MKMIKSNRTLVVTGANGLLGRALLGSLTDCYDIRAVVHTAPLDPVPKVRYHVVDLSSEWNFDELPAKADIIVHLAQSAQFRNFPNGCMDVFKVNIASTARLLDYAHKVNAEKFIFASSGGVYGNSSNSLKENSPIAPPGQLGYYLGSKMCGEILVQSYASVFQVVVLRPFFIFGKGQNRAMLIPRLMDNVSADRPIMLQGQNGIRINPVHVQDASEAIMAALSLEQSATFNIAGPDVLSIREICEGMGRFLGKKPIFQTQFGDPQDLIGNNAAMCRQLIQPQYRLLNSLNDVLL
jgi:nucleoside-diphosphate-sugar epimerase